jgi:hypothetical protein
MNLRLCFKIYARVWISNKNGTGAGWIYVT